MSSDTTLPADWPPLLDKCRAWAAGVAVHIGCGPAMEDRLLAYRLSVLADLKIGATRDFWSRWWHENTPQRIPNIERRRRADSYREDAAALRLALLAVWP